MKIQNIAIVFVFLIGCSSQPILSSCPPPAPPMHDTLWRDVIKTDTSLVYKMLRADSSHPIDLKASSGAKGDGISDDQPVLQGIIDKCLAAGIKNFYLPAARYGLTKGLIFGRQDATFTVDVTIGGDGAGYDDAPGQTVLVALSGNSFGINLQRVKGLRMHGIYAEGFNFAPANYNVPAVCNNNALSFVSPGVRDDQYSPHAGIGVDLFGDASIPMADRYPGFENWYINSPAGGSTDIEIRDCGARGWTVDYLLSPHGYPQNGEIVRLVNCWGDQAKVAVAIGQSQNRSVQVNNFHCWGGVKTVFDMQNYGNQAGCPPIVTGLNLAGSARYLCALNTWTSEPLVIRDSHIESLWSLGGCVDPTGGGLVLEDTWTALTGSLPASYYGVAIEQPHTTFQGGMLRVNGGHLWQYGTAYSMPLAFTCGGVFLQDTKLEWIPVDNYANAILRLRNSWGPSFIYDSAAVDYVGFRGTIQSVIVDTANLQTTFLLAPADYDSISIGQMLFYHTPDEYGLNYLTPLGAIISKSAGKVITAGRAVPLGSYNAEFRRVTLH